MSASIYRFNNENNDIDCLIFHCGKTFRDQVLASPGPVPSKNFNFGHVVCGQDILDNIEEVVKILKENGHPDQAEYFKDQIHPDDYFYIG